MNRLLFCLFVLASRYLDAQVVNASQQVLLQGLRTSAGQGSFRAASYAPDGCLVLLYDQSDGVRLLKTDAAGNTILAQTQTGAAGDSGLAMAQDPAGNLYVAGTTTSSVLTGTSGAAFSSRSGSSINSFLAKYDANLNLIFLTFLGSGRTSVVGVAATADAVFVTGDTFDSSFPVTPAGIQQTPALNAAENGFVERFTTDGSTLVYATYLTGANGNTVPSAIVADSSDNAYVAGSTSAAGYPTISALQPAILGTNSGFLTKLTPAGDGFLYSTFLAGTGITSLALDAVKSELLLTGNIALGQFPVETVSMPLTSASYQSLLRLPLDGQSVTSSVVLVPGSQSHVSAGPDGGAWIAGTLTTPLFPGVVPPNYNSGDSFLLHLTAGNLFDQTLRVGGTVVNNPNYASLISNVVAPAVTGSTVALPGTLQPTLSASLLPTQRFDLPLLQAPKGGLLPNTLRDVLPVASTCSSQCNGSGALLALVSTAKSTPSLSLSIDDLPNVTLRNLGSAAAIGLAITASGFSITSNCATTLEPSNQCSLALGGTGPGSITVSASNAAAATAPLGVNSLQPDSVVLDRSELDFGIVTSLSPSTQTVTITNLTASSQIFSSKLDGEPATTGSFSEFASDCASGGQPGTHVLAANSVCHITISLTVSSLSTSDGPVNAFWKIGSRDLILTGFAQAAALSVSATEVDFGTHFSVNGVNVGINLPRYLYLSNNSSGALAHAAAALPAGSAFNVVDNCPSTLDPHTVCQLELTYSSAGAPSQDAMRLFLDAGIGVLLTGTTLPPTSVTSSSTNPSLSVSTTSVSFSTPVVVTGVSGSTQSVIVKNTGASSFSLSTSISGDFALTSGCPNQLSGGASCTLVITFLPSLPGPRLGLLSLIAGSGFSPTYLSLSGTATSLLPPNNGILDLGQTLVDEPVVAWYKVQQPVSSLSVRSNSDSFHVAIVSDTGSGHGTLPSADFTTTQTASCNNCWLGVQFLSHTVGLQGGMLSVSTVSGGTSYELTLMGIAVPNQGVLLAPAAQDFGTVSVNSTSAPVTFTLTDLLMTGVAVQSATATGDFTISSNSIGGAPCTGALPSTASCFIQVVFSPSAIGQRTGLLTVVTAGGVATSTLTGYGTTDPGVGFTPTELDFSNVPGSSATQQTLTLANTGSTTSLIGPAVSSDPSFTVVSSCATLSPGSHCAIVVGFTPQSATISATISIPVTTVVNGQASTSVYTIPLKGGYTTSDSGLQILPAEVNFGSSATGSLGGTRQFTINNLTGKPLNMVLQMPRQFPLAAGAMCTTIPAAGSCMFAVDFLPATDGPVTGTVYVQGTSPDGSISVQALAYMLGYGAGTGTLAVNGLPIPYSPVSFGQVGSGQSVSQTLTLANDGGDIINIRRISTAPPFFATNTCASPLASGSNCSVTITYNPVYQIGSGSSASAARSDSGTLTIESDAASSPDVVSLNGLASAVVTSGPSNAAVLAAYTLSQSALTFVNTQVGSISAPQTLTLTNNGTMPLQISSIAAPADFAATTTCSTLFVGASCAVTVALAPVNTSASSLRSGTLEILSNASASLEFVSLLGISSSAPLTFSPSSPSFGFVDVGSSSTLLLSVTNTTAAPIAFLNFASTGDYTVAPATCPAGGVLPAGSTCTFSLTFAPSVAGTRTGSVTLTTDATPLPLTVSLTGIGVQLVVPVPTFVLTVNGGSTANVTVASGSPAVFNLLLTPVNSYVGSVALTCTPIIPAPYAGCSVVPSALILNGSALSSVATISTITTASLRAGTGAAVLFLLPALFRRRQRGGWLGVVAAAVLTGFVIVGCGSAGHPMAGSGAASNIRTTPAGTYQYQVTANAVGGGVTYSTVTLNLIVQ